MKKDNSIIIKDVTNEIDEEHQKLYDIFPSNEIFPVENIRNACQKEKLRNIGYGHKIVEKLKKIYNEYNGIIVEIERFNDLLKQARVRIQRKLEQS